MGLWRREWSLTTALRAALRGAVRLASDGWDTKAPTTWANVTAVNWDTWS